MEAIDALIAIAVVGIGGFFGGISRWALAKIPAPYVGTFAANVIGSAVLGIAVMGPGFVPLAFGTGFAGGLSTWSTLSRELGGLIKSKRWRKLATYAAATLLVGIVAAWRGTIWGGLIFAAW
ncbi:FluC/FEX family fluoride channel [Corynebacterium lubricantis]|uniref:FluC/FEX family fluoride channel n=1 Tax=Corynebacterium lubricantis TaxID=541095 RepID=UPI000375C97F|nr:CrcB family protein [Corynebacterium lubricantis]